MKNFTWLAASALLATGGAACAAEHVVPQKGKAFAVSTLSIKAGDKVSFRNDDPFVHNIFSLSDAMQFDLGTYPQGQAKSVVFSKPGKYDIECAIHPDMKLVITVAP
jgi:plastocyanin